MVKTIALFFASLFLTIAASAVFAQSTPTYNTDTTNMGTGTTTATTNVSPTTDQNNNGATPGVGGSGVTGVMPSRPPTTGLGGLSQ